MILITAHGRSGTHYTAAVLQALGLDVPHETLGKDGTVSWKHIMPGDFVVIGKGRTQVIPDVAYTHILHQVRNPLSVIASAQTFSESSWRYMEQKLGLDSPAYENWPSARYGPFTRSEHSMNTLMIRGMRTWLGWNRLIEARAEWRFQIERLTEVFPEFLDRLGIAPQPFPDVPKSRQDSRQDRKRHRSVGIDDLMAANENLAAQVIELAVDYGYNLK